MVYGADLVATGEATYTIIDVQTGKVEDRAQDSPVDLGFREVFSATASRMSALNADSSTSSPSWRSIARLALPSRLALKSLLGSFNRAPLKKVSLTTFLYVSPVQIGPS